MDNSHNNLTILREIFNQFEALLAAKTEAEITAPSLEDDWSIKDVIGHLRAWQQITIARLEAGHSGGAVVFPDWLQGQDPDADDNPVDFNARIYAIYHTQSWAQVHKAWQDGFLHLLDLGMAIPDQTLKDTKKYPWLKGYSLDDVLYWSREHHEEHLDTLQR